MKRGFILLATFTLSSALYAQGTLTREEARDVFATYNPALLQQAKHNENLNQFLDEFLNQYLATRPADTLENRYTLIALARNFENSLALNQILSQYQQALVYSQLAPSVQLPARRHAAEELRRTYARIWAVSIQVKEDLANAYRQQKRQATQQEKEKIDLALESLQQDLKQLRTDPGRQIVLLTRQALHRTEQASLSAYTAWQQPAQVSPFSVKTHPQKPMAG